MTDYYQKYQKYKQKYLNFKNKTVKTQKNDFFEEEYPEYKNPVTDGDEKYLDMYDDYQAEIQLVPNEQKLEDVEEIDLTHLDGGIIVYMFLGALPKTDIQLWDLHFEDANNKNIKIIVHEKDNPSVATGKFSSHNIDVIYLQNDEHIETKWAGISLVDTALLMWQHAILKYNVSNVVFLPYDAIPLYKFNDIKSILDKFKKSLFCYPFNNVSFNEVRGYLKFHDKITRKNYKTARPTTVPLCSQWFIINNRDFKYYFHSKTLDENKIPTYIKSSIQNLNDENFLSLNNKLWFNKNFWYYKYLGQVKYETKRRNINIEYLKIPHFMTPLTGGNILPSNEMYGGAYDENFFCKFFLTSQNNYIEKSSSKYKKIIDEFINLSTVMKKSNFYDNFQNNALYKIKFKDKQNSKEYILNTYHNTYDEIMVTSCPVSVYHMINTIDVTSKLNSIWVNGTKKISNLKGGYYDIINEIIKDITSTNVANNNKTHYIDIIKKISDLFNKIINNDESINLVANNDKFIVSTRDHPLLFIIEPMGMCICAYLLLSLLKIINIINKKNLNDNMAIYENDYEEVPNNLKYLFVWNDLINIHHVALPDITFDKYKLFPNNKLSLNSNICIIKYLIHISKQILNLPYIYDEYLMQLPNFSRNYLINSINSGSLFIRKIQIQKNVKISDLDPSHILARLLTIQYDTFTEILNKSTHNPLDNLFNYYDYEIKQHSLKTNILPDNINELENILLINSTKNNFLFSEHVNILEFINNSLGKDIISPNFNYHNDSSIMKKSDSIFNIIDDFINKYIIDSNIKKIILQYTINIFNILLEQYNKLHPELHHPIILVMKGGFLMYNLLLEIFESFPKKIMNILLLKYNDTIYSYDLDFSIKINPEGISKEEFDIHYTNCKKIILYATFWINYFVSFHLDLTVSQQNIKLLYNKINNEIMTDQNSNYKNMEFNKIEFYGMGSFEINDNYLNSNTIDITNGIINTKITTKQYLIDIDMINKVLGINNNKTFKLAIKYDDTNNWVACKNKDGSPNERWKIINTVVNVYVPVKLYFTDNKNKTITKYFIEPFIDIAIADYSSHEYISGYTIAKYNYIGNKITFYGYTLETLIKIIEQILLEYCVEKNTLTIQNAKYIKRSKILTLLYCVDILLYSKINKIPTGDILKNIKKMIEMVDKTILKFDDIIKMKKISNINLNLTEFANYKINNLFIIINRILPNIDFNANFDNFYYLLDTLKQNLKFIYNLVNDNNIYEKLTIGDIYNSDFLKYNRLIKKLN